MKSAQSFQPTESTPVMDFGPVRVLFGEKSGKYPDGNQVVVRGKTAMAAFDTPLSANRFPDALAGADLALLSHIHEDHTAGLHLLTEAEVWVHESDVNAVRSLEGLMAHYGYEAHALEAMKSVVVDQFSFQPRPDAKGYKDGQIWDLGGCQVRAVHLPGHTGGHCALVVEPEGVAFIADIDLSSFGPYYGDKCSSLSEFRSSLARVETMEAKVWVTSHHKGVITDRDEFLGLLKAFRSKLDTRAEEIQSTLSSKGHTAESLVGLGFLYPVGYKNEYSHDAELRTIELHLEELVERGQAVYEDGRYFAQ